MNFLKYRTHNRGPFYELLRLFLHHKNKILDVGCGDGEFSKYFSEYDIRGIDKNESGINKWISSSPININSNSIDVIHCSHLVEHLYPHELYNLLIEFDRILKPSGIICISAPLLWKNFYSDMSHIRPYTPSVFINYFTSNKSENRTNPVIGGYELLSLTYRYQPRILPIFTKSGYTIILKKQSIIVV